MGEHTRFDGTIPEFYDRGMGPVMFAPYAHDLAARLAVTGARTVLEAACGTGILTRALRAACAPEVHLTATDLSPAMLAYARGRLGTLPNTDWQPADLTALPFTDARFDAVVCQFGVMFPSDKAAVFRELRRVLRPGGQLLFNVWDTHATNPYAATVHRTLAELFPDDPPQFFALPFSFADRARLRTLLMDHRFSDPALEAVAATAHSPTARALATGMLRGSPIVTSLLERGIELEIVIDRVAAALAVLGGAAPFASPMQAVVCSARAA